MGFGFLDCFDPLARTQLHRPLIDYLYFGFVTGTTVGYGDLTPCNTQGKLITIIHVLASTLAFALALALIVTRALNPRETIVFSSKLILDRERNKLLFRIINTHRSKLLNPQIRVSATQHAVGNLIAGVGVLKKDDTLPWLDRHDFSIEAQTKADSGFDVVEQFEKAIAHNKGLQGGKDHLKQSRFKVEVVVSGTYGTQPYAQATRFWADDIVEGVSFSPIEYNDEDQRRRLPIRYKRFPAFWSKFNEVR